MPFEVMLCFDCWFLGMFEKLQKVTVSFVMAVCLEKLGSHWTDFDETLHLSFFLKICQEISSFIKIQQE
jgi:hypothetical protein